MFADRPDYPRERYTIMKRVDQPVMVIGTAKRRESLGIIEQIAENDAPRLGLNLGDPQGNVGRRITVGAGDDN